MIFARSPCCSFAWSRLVVRFYNPPHRRSRRRIIQHVLAPLVCVGPALRQVLRGRHGEFFPARSPGTRSRAVRAPHPAAPLEFHPFGGTARTGVRFPAAPLPPGYAAPPTIPKARFRA